MLKMRTLVISTEAEQICNAQMAEISEVFITIFSRDIEIKLLFTSLFSIVWIEMLLLSLHLSTACCERILTFKPFKTSRQDRVRPKMNKTLNIFYSCLIYL